MAPFDRDLGRIEAGLAALGQRINARIIWSDERFEEIDEQLKRISAGIQALTDRIADDREARQMETAYRDGTIRGATWVGGVVIAAASAVGTWVFSHFPVIDMIAGVLFKRPPSP